LKDKVVQHHTGSSAQSSASQTVDAEGRGQDRTLDRKKFNSTSSIYVTSTLTVPNTTKLLTNMSHLLNAQICVNRAEREHGGRASKTDIFDETRWMNLDYTDRQHVPTPKAHDIFLFLASMFDVVMFSPECNVISLVYLNRLSQSSCYQVVINHLNWRTVILSTFMVAQKVWDDKPLINVDFGLVWRRIVPQSKACLTIEAINTYERAILNSLQFDLLISSSQYAN
jgi:hypothetical protein